MLKIIAYPNPILRKKCKAVRTVDDCVRKLIDNMFETMHAAPGIGLAANQVGELVRIIVVDVGNNPIALVNPKFVKRSGSQVYTEGCLSLVGVEGPVERFAKIMVKGLDRNGKAITIAAEGLTATALQHEMDHLDGNVFIDRVKDPSRIRYIDPMIEKKEEKL